MRVEGSALVAVRRNLRTKCGYSVRSTATLRADAQSKRPKSAKGVWVGETNEVCLRNVRVFPHKRHVVFVEPDFPNSPVDFLGSIFLAGICKHKQFNGCP